MCGIVGIATKQFNGFTNAEGDMFRDMLYLDAFRGWDSTGVFGVDKHSNVQVHKEASQAADFIHTDEFKKFKGELVQRGLFAVGHNRAATRGEVVDKNAHPFVIDDKIVLVQNGTWRGDHKKIKDTEVDTEALAHIIADNEDVEKAIQEINAAYALCWFNTSTNSLYLIRNFERPLWFAETQSGTITWASEAGFIQLAAMRNNITLKERPVMLDPHILVKFTIKGNNWERTDTKVNPFRQTQAKSVWEDNDDDDTLFLPHRPGNYRPHIPGNTLPQIPTMGRSVRTNVPIAKTAVIKSFSDEAYALIADAHAPSGPIAAQCQGVWRERITEKKKCLVELEDYISANDHPECSTWHVWGRSVEPEGHIAEHALIHWFLYNKTEAEVMQYVNGFHEFIPAHTKKEEYPGNTEIVSVMATSSSIVKLETTETLVQ